MKLALPCACIARAAAFLAASAAFTCAPLAQAEEVASVNTLPASAQTDVVVEAKLTERPADDIATSVTGELAGTNGPIAGNVIVCVPWLTVND